jgi:hypothetical protein
MTGATTVASSFAIAGIIILIAGRKQDCSSY